MHYLNTTCPFTYPHNGFIAHLPYWCTLEDPYIFLFYPSKYAI